jgi:hypothetical protein
VLDSVDTIGGVPFEDGFVLMDQSLLNRVKGNASRLLYQEQWQKQQEEEYSRQQQVHKRFLTDPVFNPHFSPNADLPTPPIWASDGNDDVNGNTKKISKLLRNGYHNQDSMLSALVQIAGQYSSLGLLKPKTGSVDGGLGGEQRNGSGLSHSTANSMTSNKQQQQQSTNHNGNNNNHSRSHPSLHLLDTTTTSSSTESNTAINKYTSPIAFVNKCSIFKS